MDPVLYEPSNPLSVALTAPLTILGGVGQGTHGEVFRVEIDRHVYAVKRQVIRHGLLQSSFLREVAALTRCQHPYIISLWGAAINKFHTYLVLPLAESSVGALLKAQRLNLSQKYEFTYQLLTAVSYLQANNILHLDLKPDNLLVRQGSLRLADFGSSQGLFCVSPDDPRTDLTTPGYLAPEMILRENVGSGADRWGMAVNIYEIFTGQRLFRGMPDIFRHLGTPSEAVLQKFPRLATYSYPTASAATGFPLLLVYGEPIHQLVVELLDYDPDQRPRLDQYFAEEVFSPYRNELAETHVYGSCYTNLLRRSYPFSMYQLATEFQLEDVLALKQWLLDINESLGARNAYFHTCILLDRLGEKGYLKKSGLGLTGLACLYLSHTLTLGHAKSVNVYMEAGQDLGIEPDWDLYRKRINLVLDRLDYDLIFSHVYDFYRLKIQLAGYTTLSSENGWRLCQDITLMPWSHELTPDDLSEVVLLTQCLEENCLYLWSPASWESIQHYYALFRGDPPLSPINQHLFFDT